MRREFTIEDMRRFAGEAWGSLGESVVERWCEFNIAYFDGALRPVPLVITNTLPFGKRIAFCSYDPDQTGRTITLNVPRQHRFLLADNNALLHEMLHQFLFESGENPKHAGEPWRREIMRLTKLITGADIWVGASKPVRKGKRVVRMNIPHPKTGRPSLTQTQSETARWPHDHYGIDLGQLGA